MSVEQPWKFPDDPASSTANERALMIDGGYVCYASEELLASKLHLVLATME